MFKYWMMARTQIKSPEIVNIVYYLSCFAVNLQQLPERKKVTSLYSNQTSAVSEKKPELKN
jgi:hypothetical protein